jgi:uncharacterized protein
LSRQRFNLVKHPSALQAFQSSIGYSLTVRIVIFGGHGHVGQSLINHFNLLGWGTTIVSRRGPVVWDGKTLGDWTQAIEGTDAVINLAGRSVNCRYNVDNLKEMMESRVDSTRVLGQAIAQASNPPKVWLQSSTATIYRHTFDEANGEDGVIGSEQDPVPRKWQNSVEIARAWEAALYEFDTPGTRRVALRTAMVMAPIEGSIFSVLSKLTKRGLMGVQGSGRQYVSWIHEKDFCEAIEWILNHSELDGPINVSSPNPLPQKQFAEQLRKALGAKIGLPATALMLEVGTFLMKSETELVLKSRRVVPAKLLKSGFTFKHPDWGTASLDLAKKINP